MTTDVLTFAELNLPDSLLKALDKVGYEKPSPIQAQSIPLLLEGRNLIGQAQTGTGKTAAFALPMLAQLDVEQSHVQCLVLAPTRELAIQVSEAFQTYASFSNAIRVLPIYGGQAYGNQIRQLKRGVHVVVGTPGRIIDHIDRGTLKLDNLRFLVLDEADEMLRMGFIDDVEKILSHAPKERQTALFSATMPEPIKRISKRYLDNPEQIKIAAKVTTASTIRQRYCQVSGHHKLEALTRIMEVEAFDAMIIFVRTKTATQELADKLAARGHDVEPLNGDIPQQARERTVEKLKQGKIDILVATDVVARGLDVERITHVVNFDIPYDTESYVHRIGRTGRAGREGDAILFISHREKRMLKAIERATRQSIAAMPIPSISQLNETRLNKFKQSVLDATRDDKLEALMPIVDMLEQETEVSPEILMAALVSLAQGNEPLMLKEADHPNLEEKPRKEFDRPQKSQGRERRHKPMEAGMQRYRIDVGRNHNVKPSNIVGAIANEANIDSQHIGAISIFDNFSTVDLPEGMPKEVKETLRKARVSGQRLNIREWSEKPPKRRK